MPKTMPEYYIGLMSGTSMDGIDAALVDFSPDETGSTPRLLCTHSQAWPDNLIEDLLASRKLSDNELRRLDMLDRAIGEHFASAADALLHKAGLPAKDVTAIGSHGQTIRHRPDIEQPFSLQLGNAGTIARQTGIDVVSDFRSADIEAGGQGAPLAPAFHKAVFRTDNEDRSVLNIGGITNLSLLPADANQPVTGFDCGPGNTLMDAWMMKTNNMRCDHEGAFARSGQINDALLKNLLSDPYFQKTPPKSTGFEDFNLGWLGLHMKRAIPAEDVQATLCELTARTVSDAVKHYAMPMERLLVCGGGVHNAYLMERLRDYLHLFEVESTAEKGIDPDWVEAMAFAWLARQTMKGLPGNLPSVTGAREATVLGNITRA